MHTRRHLFTFALIGTTQCSRQKMEKKVTSNELVKVETLSYFEFVVVQDINEI